MRHPDHRVLRRLLDEPAGVTDADRQHVAGCPQCLGALAATRQDASLPGTAPGMPSDPGAGLSAAAPATGHRPPTRRTARLGAPLRRPAVAALAAAAVLAGAGAAAATTDGLPFFRTEHVEPVDVSAADVVAVPDLRAYGDVSVTGDGGPRPVPDAAAAAAQTGLDVPRVGALPRGVGGEPEHAVIGEVTATFTFSADRAARAAREAGVTLPSAPPGLDGATVRLVAGPGTAQVWSGGAGAPALVVARAVAPSASSRDVPFTTVRDYLLSLPGVPADVAARLRTFRADGSTLPLPVPSDQVTTSSADVNGSPAPVLSTRDRTMAAVVWVDDGLVSVVAGALGTDEVLSVARELR